MGALEAGQAYLKQVLAKLPEGQRAQAEAIFNDAAAAAAIQEVGAGVLRQEDYSRQTDVLRTEQQKAQELYNKNLQWYQQNEADLKSLPQLQQELAAARSATPAPAAPNPPTPGPTDGYVKLEDLQGIVQESLGLHVVIPTLIGQHFARFNEQLTEDQVRQLVIDAQTHRRSIKDQYSLTFGEKIAAADAKAKAEYEERLRQEGEQRFRAANPNMPYPVRGTGEIGSPLDQLAAKDRSGLPTPDALAAEYQQLVMTKGASA